MTTAQNLNRQIDLERRLLDQLRNVREFQAQLLRDYSKAHGFCIPLTVDQFREHSRRAA
jgi:spore coat protein CotF